MTQVAITVNGKLRKAHVEPRTLLVHFLRDGPQIAALLVAAVVALQGRTREPLIKFLAKSYHRAAVFPLGRWTGSCNSASHRWTVLTPRPRYVAISFHELRTPECTETACSNCGARTMQLGFSAEFLPS